MSENGGGTRLHGGVRRDRPAQVMEGRLKVAFKKIMVPVDLSEESGKIFDYAQSLAERSRAEVMLVHVLAADPYEICRQTVFFVPAPYQSDPPPASEEADSRLREAIGIARGRLKDLARERANVKIAVRTGEIVDELLAEAENSGADLVLMGTHGWTGLRHLVLGSVAEKMVRLCPVPVLTWRNVGI
ncbi:MAG: universal stress protein [bacterium]